MAGSEKWCDMAGSGKNECRCRGLKEEGRRKNWALITYKLRVFQASLEPFCLVVNTATHAIIVMMNLLSTFDIEDSCVFYKPPVVDPIINPAQNTINAAPTNTNFPPSS